MRNHLLENSGKASLTKTWYDVHIKLHLAMPMTLSYLSHICGTQKICVQFIVITNCLPIFGIIKEQITLIPYRGMLSQGVYSL